MKGKIAAAVACIVMAACLFGCASSTFGGSSSDSATNMQSSNTQQSVKENFNIDEFIITGASQKSLSKEGYIEVSITVKNNTDGTLHFLGFNVQELDVNNNILNSYESYNKNAQEVDVEAGQQMTIALTEDTSNGLDKIKSTGYKYGDSISKPTNGKFSEPFIYTIQK